MLPGLRTVVVEPDESWVTVYSHHRREQLFNTTPSGDSRFSPLAEPDGAVVGAAYLARNPVGALLETSFHDIRPTGIRRVSVASDLAGRGLRRITIGQRILLADLRDSELDRHGLARSQIVSTSPAHYRCTRRWANRIRKARPGGRHLSGIMWNSRVAEMAAAIATPTVASLLTGQQTEVCVLYSTQLSADLSAYAPAEIHADLSRGGGLEAATDLAVQLGGLVDL